MELRCAPGLEDLLYVVCAWALMAAHATAKAMGNSRAVEIMVGVSWTWVDEKKERFACSWNAVNGDAFTLSRVSI
ncbi:hypothetical protein D3C71_2068290 [compost metagenome]